MLRIALLYAYCIFCEDTDFLCTKSCMPIQSLIHFALDEFVQVQALRGV